MKFKNRLLGLLLVLSLVFILASTALAEEKDPITIDADSISYDSESGDFTAKGNVLTQQQKMFLQADNLDGNMKLKDMHAYGNVLWTKENDKLTGNELFYNYGTQVGFLEKGQGFVENRYLKADWIEKDTEKITAQNGWLTKCDAEEIKCYEITAKKLVIYPGQKMIAYDASFWVRGKKLFTLKKYTKSLKKKDNRNSGLPTMGYSSEKGFFLNYRYNLAMDEKTGIDSFLAFDYYGKLGTHLRVQSDKDTEKEHWNLVVGRSIDKDNKELDTIPSLSWQRKSQRIGKTSLSYNYGLGLGYFRQQANNASTWRANANIGLVNDPIPLWKQASLNLWTSYQDNRYGTQDKLGVWSYGAGISQGLGERGSLGVSYVHREISGKTPFNFDDPGVANEMYAGLGYQIDPYWNIRVSATYDLDTSKYTDIDYILTRKLHCFEARVMWREKRQELDWSIDLVNF